MAPRKLKIACAGLGRMGKRHALHFLNRTPRAELVAASTPDDTEIQWAKQHLEPYGVRIYKDYDEMLKQEGLEAVVIASVTTVHAEQAIKAIEANLHVLCEKPLSTSVEIVSIPNRSSPNQELTHKITVTERGRRSKEEAKPESDVRVFSPIRRLIPRCLPQNGHRTHRQTIHLSLSNLRYARPLRFLRRIR
jgi:Oxidoreductase family, NAD-binding Rossmann fold